MVRSPSPLLTPPSLLLPTPPSLMLLPRSSIIPSRSATTPGCPSDLPLLIYNSPSMVTPSRLTRKTTLSCVTTSNLVYLTLSLFLFPTPSSSTLIEPPASTIRKPSRSWLVFSTGQGGTGFHHRGPAATRARGAFFRGMPAPSPVRHESSLIPLTEPRFSPPKITGAHLGNGRGRRRG